MTTVRASRARAAALLTAITMTALLAACSADDSGGSDAVEVSDGGQDTSSESRGSNEPGDADGAGDSGGAADRATSDGPGSEDSGSTSRGPSTPDLERSVISSGTISLASKDVADTRREVQRVVDAQGGQITEETTESDSDGETSYSRLVVRVPSSRFGAAMVALEQAGVLRSSSRGSDDVTTEVIDTGVRVRAQEASLKRVELLLAEARSLKDIIWIESQLTSRQAELDSLKSQQSWLSDQTSMSTITVDISTQPGAVDEPEEEDEPAGFLAGLRGGTKALDTTLSAVTTVIGALLPFAAVALVLGLPVWLVLRRRRTAAAAPEVAAHDTP
ncbi:hypothetical protein GCM10023339_09030 [Alloalcanivorax gelatiniphagus]